jgi:clan AA aspartic protease (TIGR02281 family)
MQSPIDAYRGEEETPGTRSRRAGSHGSEMASAYPSSPVHVWLFLLTIFVGIIGMNSSAGAGKRHEWINDQGEDCLSDTPPQAQLAAVQEGRRGVTEQSGRLGVTEQPSQPGADPGKAKIEPLPPSGHARSIVVDALLNRQLSVPLVLDTGATYTVLTKQTAQDLGITGLERLPKQHFLTAGGKILSPVTTLKSIRVGTAEAQNVEVAIDVDGHLPMGLLGMTFMRHFKVTMDQEQGQVKFERR